MARAKGMSNVAKEAGVSRANLYRALNSGGRGVKQQFKAHTHLGLGSNAENRVP